jgi:prepilin-type processing-associated H-X9-DG protein
MKALLGLLAVCVVTATALTTWEGGVAMLFGWISFLGRVLPRLSADWPSIAVGLGAVVLFAAGIHALGFSWQRQRTAPEGEPRPAWRFRSTFAVVALVIILFTAGISIIGIVHQTGWLIHSDRSLYGEGLRDRGTPHRNLVQIGLGLHVHHDMKKTLPAGGTFAPDGTMLHSWETYALDGLGYTRQGIDMAKPWNDPVNQKYFKCILPQFINPGFRTAELEDAEGYGLSHYASNSHVMGGNKGMKLSDIKDGTENTLLVGEVNAQFKPWGHPANWRDPVTGINSPRGFGGPPGSGGANFVMADGSVRFVSDKISPDVLRAMSTPNGGEEIREEGWYKR